MSAGRIHAVTGAFGYSGKYIARHLLDEGREVITLTNSADREDPFGGRVEVHPFNFDEPEKLTESLRGVCVLYNTYWVRFNFKTFTFAEALENTLTLFECAKEAGVERIVHVSITNPSEESGLEYFSGKAVVEKALVESGLSYAILRPTILFGKEDILINNIAWVLRRSPVFGVFGMGGYKVQPIYVDDLAKLAVEQGRSREDKIINAVGPETFTYKQLVGEIARIIKKKRLIVPIPPRIAYIFMCIFGKIIGDVVVTRDEIEGLITNLLCVDSAPTGTTNLTDWADQHAQSLGKHYANELARRRRSHRG